MGRVRAKICRCAICCSCNANFGLTSSDGRKLFIVDDPLFFTNRQPGYPP